MFRNEFGSRFFFRTGRRPIRSRRFFHFFRSRFFRLGGRFIDPRYHISYFQRIAFLPDGRMLITEKPGPIYLVSPKGDKILVGNTPPVYFEGQNGMHGVYLSPHYATDHSIYLTYAEPGEYGGGLALARAQLHLTDTTATLENLKVLWHQMPKGKGGQEGAAVAFSPDGKYLFLSVGDRQRFTPAQDPNQPEGKVLRLTLDGKPAKGNPNYGKKGASTIPLIDPPKDTEAAKTAPVVSQYTFPGPNLTPSETWATGFRTARMDFLEPIDHRLEREGDEYKIDNSFAVQWDGPPDHNIFMQNAARQQRGLPDANLSLIAWRSQRILDRIRGVRTEHQKASFIEWSVKPAGDDQLQGA